jgi:hypothetical protein
MLHAARSLGTLRCRQCDASSVHGIRFHVRARARTRRFGNLAARLHAVCTLPGYHPAKRSYGLDTLVQAGNTLLQMRA